jgi:uncharacterized protein YndB with AHSA1/START domain
MSATLVVERELKHPPEKVWRALTEPALIAEWLMSNDFLPIVDHTFKFRADWGSVDGKVLEIVPGEMLSYTWNALGLESVVTFTLTPTGSGTRLRMEQEGFASDSDQNYRGAVMGWTRFLGALDDVVARLD